MNFVIKFYVANFHNKLYFWKTLKTGAVIIHEVAC